MVDRVVDFFYMQLPVFDIVTALKHAVMNSPSYPGILDDVRKIMLQQGVFFGAVFERKDPGLRLSIVIQTDCLSRRVGYSFDSLSAKEDNKSQYFKVENSLSNNLIDSYSVKFHISAETFAMTYSSYVDNLSVVKAKAEIGHKRNRSESFRLEDDTDWWNEKI